jgi:hypothetical protein
MMKRREFLKTSMVAVGLAGSPPESLQPLAASENNSRKPSRTSGQTFDPMRATREGNRSADYLRRVQEDKFLPKPPVVVEASRSGGVQISPMPLAERIKRKIVPRQGFCSLHGEFLIMPSSNVSANHLQLLPFLIKCRNAQSYYSLRPCHYHHLPALETGRHPLCNRGIHSPHGAAHELLSRSPWLLAFSWTKMASDAF